MDPTKSFSACFGSSTPLSLTNDQEKAAFRTQVIQPLLDVERHYREEAAFLFTSGKDEEARAMRDHADRIRQMAESLPFIRVARAR